MKLLINWTEFESVVKDFMEKGQDLLHEIKAMRDLHQFEQFEAKNGDWKKRCQKFLEDSFDDRSLSLEFHNEGARAQGFIIPGQKSNLQSIRDQTERILKARIQWFADNLRVLWTYDAVVRPNEIDLNERAELDTEGILDLLLDKLYDLYDGRQYGVKEILEGNGIQLRKRDEDRDLVKHLEYAGFVEPLFRGQAFASLTTPGKLYVEQKRKKRLADYSRIDDSKEEINQKLDEILDYVRSQGEMQQIIADELDDLRALFGSLSKKTWGQLVKGKVVDLLIAQVVSKETASFIYERITQDILKLK